MSHTTTTAALALALLALPGCLAPQADPYADLPVATPQRPTFSNATTTTQVGTFEIEAGVAVDPKDTEDVPIVLKYGVAENGEVFLAQDIYKKVYQPGTEDRGTGDTELGTRWRIWEGDPDPQTGERNSFALQASISAPTGSETKGDGTPAGDVYSPMSEGEWNAFLAAIVDGSVSGWSWTAYYRIGSMGRPNDHDRSTQHAAAFAVSRSLGGDVTGFAELAGWYDARGTGTVGPNSAAVTNPLFATVGVAFAERPDRVWDVSFRQGLNDDAPDFVVQAGVTVNMGAFGDS